MAQKRSFNLISSELKLKKTVKKEFNWYFAFNALIIAVVSSASLLAYFFGAYFESDVAVKQKELANIVNYRVNVSDKQKIKNDIAQLNDRFSLYNEIKDTGFDFNAFYAEFTSIYPKGKINSFTITPKQKLINAQVEIDADGYNEFPKFLNALYTNTIYKKSKVNSMSITKETGSLSIDVDFVRDVEEDPAGITNNSQGIE